MAWTNTLPEVINSVATRVDDSTCPAGYLKDKYSGMTEIFISVR